MNFLTRFSLKNTAAILILTVLIVVGGAYSALQLKKESMPDISIPIVGVITVYPGASPDDVRDSITEPIESAVMNVEGVKKVNTSSGENASTVIAEFDYSENMDEAQKKVEDAIKAVKIPTDAMASKIMRVDLGAFPILNLSISNDKLSPGDLEQVVRREMMPQLSSVAGVGQVTLASESEKAVYIKLKQAELDKYGLTSQHVTQMIQANNVAFPAGQVSIDGVLEPIRISGKIASLEDLKNTEIMILPNMNAITMDAIGELGQGMAGLGTAVGELGQGMAGLGSAVGDLGSAVGDLGKGMAGISQLTSAQVKLLSAAQTMQSQLFDAKLGLIESNAVLTNPGATEAQKQGATAAIQQLTPQIQMLQAGIKQVNDQLAALEKKMPASPGATTPATDSKLGITSEKNTQDTSDASENKTNNNEDQTFAIEKVKLSEIADIYLGTSELDSYSRTNGKSSVIMNIVKTQDSNTMAVSSAAIAKLEALKAKMPEGTEIEVITDQADNVKESIDGMMREGIIGALFAFLVILLFLRNIRTTIIATVSIPLSVLITVVFLKQLDITLNIMTLGGISVAVGRIVDDSIVVIENIYRRLQKETVKSSDLIISATKEVSSAITSSTLTTVAVFLPIGLVDGFSGVLFRPFAITVGVALLSSLLVAVTVIPLLSRIMLMNTKIEHHADFHQGKMMTFYQGLLKWSLNHKAITLLLALVILVSSAGLVPFIGTSFMPEAKDKYITATVELPAGADLEVVNKDAEALENYFGKDTLNVLTYQTKVGKPNSDMGVSSASAASNKASILVKLSEETDVDQYIADFRKDADQIGVKGKLDIEQSNPSNGSPTTNDISILVTGSNFENISQGAKEITKALEGVTGIERIKNTLTDSKPEISIVVDQKKATENGLSAAQVGMTIRGLLNDNTVTSVSFDNQTYDVKLGIKISKWDKISSIENVAIQSPTGKKLKISDIAVISETAGPVAILTEDGQKYVSVTAKCTEKNTGAVSTRVSKVIEGLTLPSGVKTSMGGVTEMMSDSFKQLGVAMIAAVFAVFLVMVIALGEATASLAILFSLPLAAIGGLVALFISGLQIDMPAMIGALMLIGIVVTNAIVLVDRVQQNRSEGTNMRDALVEAGMIRMRPILMTAIATIAALMPLAFGISEGSLLSQSLAVVVIGGLAMSTLLTLIVVPVAYEMLEGLKGKPAKGPVANDL